MAELAWKFTRTKQSMSKAKSKTSTEQWLVIFCGFPGCGKSTTSTALEKQGFVRINQDDLGTADECKKLLEKSLKHGRSCILDRCNIHPKDRKMWMTNAKQVVPNLNIDLVWFNVDVETCKQRVRERKKHPTLSPENGDKVIEEFAKGFKPPEMYEGYKHIHTIVTFDDAKNVISELSKYNIAKK
jgi:predicted kinase